MPDLAFPLLKEAVRCLQAVLSQLFSEYTPDALIYFLGKAGFSAEIVSE